MANIEMRGIDIAGEAGYWQIQIMQKFKEADLGRETIITNVSSHPNYCEDGTLAPFFRIWGETKEEIDRVIEILKELEITKKFDIETIVLNSFIPKDG